MRPVLTLLFSLATVITYSQHVVIFKDKKTLPCESVKFRDEAVLVKTEGGDEQRIPVDQVDGYYNHNRSTILYLRPNYVREFNLVNLFTGDHDYKLFERVLHGRIDVFSYTVRNPATPPGMPVTPQTYYFIQKDSTFKSVFPGFFQSRENMKDLLAFVSDNATISANLNDLNYHFTTRNMVDAIREYNVLMFKSPGKKAFDNTSSVSFFASLKSKQDSARLVVNDSITYPIKSKYPFTVHLPTDLPSKICVSTHEGTLCEVITPNAFMMEYYEVNLASKGRPVDIELRPIKYVQEYSRRARQQ
jgi:hypothetical protein